MFSDCFSEYFVDKMYCCFIVDCVFVRKYFVGDCLGVDRCLFGFIVEVRIERIV